MRIRDRVCLAAGAAALLTSVLVVGGTLRWTQAIVAGLVALAAGTQVLARRQLDRLSPLVLLIGLAIGLTAIQLIPLPSGILEALNPTGTQLRIDGAAIARSHPWNTISLDPAQTLRALTFFVTLLAVALLALRFAASERGRFMLLASVAVVCGLAALVTGVHTLVNADSLYGLYEPQHMHAPAVFGPLLNPNHLGGLMGIGAVLSLGLAFYDRQATQLRVLWIVIGLSCVIVGAASRSRGAMVGLVIGLVVAIAILIASRLAAPNGSRRRRGLRADLPLILVVGVGLALALYTSAGNVIDQLDNTSLTELNQPSSKYAAWKSSLTLIAESPWLGVGRGAVESTLTRVHPGSAYFTYSHLENEYLTTVVDWGVVGCVLLAITFCWGIFVARRRWRDGPLAAAALGALAMILFQSSVDFGIELLGIAIPATIVAATVQLVPLCATDTSVVLLRLRRLVLVLALGLAAFALTRPATRSVQEDHDDVAALTDPKLDDLRDVIERHPLDYFGFGESATILYNADDVNALEFLNHALMLHPSHPGLHRLAARMLVGVHRYPQAAIEYSLAMAADGTPHNLLTEIVAVLPDPNDAAAAIPLDYPSIDIVMHSLRDINRLDIAEKWLAKVAQRPQHDLRVIDMLYELAMLRKDLDAAKAAADLRLTVTHTLRSRLMLAKVQFLLKEFDVLLATLADVPSWNGPIDGKADAWFILCDVHIEQRDWNAALACIHRLDASGLLVVGGRLGINRRLETITEQRTYESKMEAVKAMEKSLHTPSSEPPLQLTPPIVPATTPTPTTPKPTLGIPNPFEKPSPPPAHP